MSSLVRSHVRPPTGLLVAIAAAAGAWAWWVAVTPDIDARTRARLVR